MPWRKIVSCKCWRLSCFRCNWMLLDGVQKKGVTKHIHVRLSKRSPEWMQMKLTLVLLTSFHSRVVCEGQRCAQIAICPGEKSRLKTLESVAVIMTETGSPMPDEILMLDIAVCLHQCPKGCGLHVFDLQAHSFCQSFVPVNSEVALVTFSCVWWKAVPWDFILVSTGLSFCITPASVKWSKPEKTCSEGELLGAVTWLSDWRPTQFYGA